MSALAQAQDSAAALAPSARRSSALAQVAYGPGFHDSDFGFATRHGMMSTLALAVGTEWGRHHGSLVAALLGGSFVDATGAATGEHTHMLVEWTSEVGFHRAPSRVEPFIAGMLTRDGAGFEANQLGLGARTTGGGAQLGLTIFYRRVLGARADTKSRLDWVVPLSAGPVHARLIGYEDLVVGPRASPSLSGVPTLVVLAGSVIGRTPADLQVGVKWFEHRSATARTSAPQIVVRVPLA